MSDPRTDQALGVLERELADIERQLKNIPSRISSPSIPQFTEWQDPTKVSDGNVYWRWSKNAAGVYACPVPSGASRAMICIVGGGGLGTECGGGGGAGLEAIIDMDGVATIDIYIGNGGAESTATINGLILRAAPGESASAGYVSSYTAGTSTYPCYILGQEGRGGAVVAHTDYMANQTIKGLRVFPGHNGIAARNRFKNSVRGYISTVQFGYVAGLGGMPGLDITDIIGKSGTPRVGGGGVSGAGSAGGAFVCFS